MSPHRACAAAVLLAAALMAQGCVAYTVGSAVVGTTAKVTGTAIGVTADAVGATSDAIFDGDEDEKARR